MPGLPVTSGEAASGLYFRQGAATAGVNQGFKEGTTGGVALPAPVALTTIPAVVLDLYEIAFLAALKAPLPSFTVATLPVAAGDKPAGRMIFVTDEIGGAVPAFSDGTDWRRVTDRAIVS